MATLLLDQVAGQDFPLGGGHAQLRQVQERFSGLPRETPPRDHEVSRLVPTEPSAPMVSDEGHGEAGPRHQGVREPIQLPGKVRCSHGCTSQKSSVYLLAGSPFPPPFQKDHTRVNSREIRPPAHPRRITRESTRGRSANPPISERLTCGRSANPPVSERSSASKLAGDLQEGEGTNCPRVSIHHPFVTYSHNHSALYEVLPGKT